MLFAWKRRPVTAIMKRPGRGAAHTMVQRKEPTEGDAMQRKDIINIVDGLRLIEEGVEKIQAVMREKKIHSLKEVAAELIPFFKEDDDSLTESIIKHLD